MPEGKTMREKGGGSSKLGYRTVAAEVGIPRGAFGTFLDTAEEKRRRCQIGRAHV